MTRRSVTIPAAMYEDMVRLAVAKAPKEAVGLVGFRAGTNEPTSFVPMENRSPEPEQTFFVMPHELYEGERALAERGCYIGAVFHSHPTSPANPSKADLEAGQGLSLICELKPEPKIRAWFIVNGRAEEVDLFTGPEAEAA